MKSVFHAALLAGALGAAALIAPSTAAARIVIGFDAGNVAFAYSDGYWDRDHRWHRWRHHDRDDYRRDHADNFHDWHHDRDSDHGWHDEHDHDH